jgi:hypothetical protein
MRSTFLNRVRHDLIPNLHRLVRLIKREGIVSAWRKGWPYLKWRMAGEIQLRNLAKTKSVEERFTKIYRWNFWQAADSKSGPGSSLPDTENLRRNLPAIFDKFGIRTMLDAPCGDFYWMKHVVVQTKVVYIGGDIVRPMIEQNTARHANDRTSFVHLDITKGPLPKADLWFCRDCFFHLSLADIFRALHCFVDSGIPNFMASSLTGVAEPKNHDILSGDFRQVDLFATPFLFPPDVLFRVDDFAPGEMSSREMCLWSRDQIIASLAASNVLAPAIEGNAATL